MPIVIGLVEGLARVGDRRGDDLPQRQDHAGMRRDRQNLPECDGTRCSGPQGQKEHGRQHEREKRAARKGGHHRHRRRHCGWPSASRRIFRVTQGSRPKADAVRSH